MTILVLICLCFKWFYKTLSKIRQRSDEQTHDVLIEQTKMGDVNDEDKSVKNYV